MCIIRGARCTDLSIPFKSRGVWVVDSSVLRMDCCVYWDVFSDRDAIVFTEYTYLAVLNGLMSLWLYI